MGRSRGVPNSVDDDASQRSKRRRIASSGENAETLNTGPGPSEGKEAQYHCNYCNKDISGKIRIKCAKCPDFDLCVECFSVGSEVTPHKSNHSYRVMDNLSFPLICPDWNADEEILLLEGIEMYGLGNWAEVAEHVGTKIKEQCIHHYTSAYMNSPCYPLPDMSRVNGKNRKELLAMAKIQSDGKKGIAVIGDISAKEESPFSPSRVKVEDLGGESLSGRPPSNLSAGASKKASNMVQLKDVSEVTKVEGVTSVEVSDTHLDRSVGVKKPKYSAEEGPSMTELSGYNPKRQEFDPEYDHDAEQSLAEMEFKDNDTEVDRELKLRVLHIYLSRLDERKRRKDFILERNLLYPNPLEKELSNEDKEVYQRYKVFMRFLSQEEHENLMRNIIEERIIRRRIQELQECRTAGCRTLAEAKAYREQKSKKELESNNQKIKDVGGQVAANTKGTPKASRPISREKIEADGSPRNIMDSHKIKGSTGLDSTLKDSLSVGQGISKCLDDWDISGLPGVDFLSETEQRLCCQNRLLPSHYLKMQEMLVQEIFKGTVVRKSDAHLLFNVDPMKIDKIYDVVMKKLGRHSDEPQPA